MMDEEPRYTILNVGHWIVIDRELEDASEGQHDDDFCVGNFDTLAEAKVAFPDAQIGE